MLQGEHRFLVSSSYSSLSESGRFFTRISAPRADPRPSKHAMHLLRRTQPSRRRPLLRARSRARVLCWHHPHAPSAMASAPRLRPCPGRAQAQINEVDDPPLLPALRGDRRQELHAHTRTPVVGRCQRCLLGEGPAVGDRAVRSRERATGYRCGWQSGVDWRHRCCGGGDVGVEPIQYDAVVYQVVPRPAR